MDDKVNMKGNTGRSLRTTIATRPTWISWHWHQRTASIVEKWGIRWVMLDTRRRGLLRYLELLTRSATVLWRLRDSTVIVQSPSVALAATAVVLAPIFGLRIVLDAHNESVRPFTHDSLAMRCIVRLIIKRAEMVIVTNDELATVVKSLGGHPFVLADAIPTPTEIATHRSRGPVPVVLIICTYASDEPLGVFIEAARQLVGRAEVRLTGHPTPLARDLLREAPENLRALGYLSESDYWTELAHADLIVDLTLKPNCLVCGAYEAVAIGKPPILSDDVSSRKLFGDVATFVDNTPDSLVQAVTSLLDSTGTVAPSVAAFRSRYVRDWQSRLTALDASIKSSTPYTSSGS